MHPCWNRRSPPTPGLKRLEPSESPDAYLKDYHRLRPGTTTRIFEQLSLDVDGVRFESSYHYLADKVPKSDTPLHVLNLACGDGFLLFLLALRKQRSLELCGVDSGAELSAPRPRRR
jgi:hypothetical protein